jgi:uncharacterized sulfatase
MNREQAGRRPNVLWLSLESVRADHTSLHGYERDTTPNLRQLSRRPDATVLDPVLSASMWTPASTASMLTGTHMSTHQVGRDGKCEKKLPASVDTLPERLAGAGYDTALFSPTYYIGPETGLDRGFQHVESLTIQKENFLGYNSLARDSIYSALRCLVESRATRPEELEAEISNSKNYLLQRRFERWSSNRGSDPFFAYVHVPSPHHPYNPVARFRDAYTADIEMDAEAAATLSERVYTGTDDIRRRMAAGLEFTEGEWAAIEAMYDAEIRYGDDTAGELVARAESDSDQPLVVVVTGDHGDLFGEYGLIGHNLVLHDGLTHVPGLVVGIEDVVDTPETVTQHVDLSRTVAAVTGISEQGLEGRDLREQSRPYAISQRGIAHLDEYLKHDSRFDADRFFLEPFSAVRTPEWKYLGNENREALYDLPDEEADVKDEHPEMRADLAAVLEEEGIDWSRQVESDSVEFDDEAKGRLKDLGYLT